MKIRTLVLGASLKQQRHSFRTILALIENDLPVYAIGPVAGEVKGVPIQQGFPVLKNIHTVTIYLSPEKQEPYIDYLLALKPRRIIFNKKTFNPVLADQARAMGIMAIEACTLVMLVKGTFEGD